MNPRELFLLSPYRIPAQNSLTLSNEDVAAFLNAYAVLWHPAALRGAAGPPSISSPYDHEAPATGHLYAVPENPPLVLPDDWDQRVLDAGAVAFRATADRQTTLANMTEALRAWQGREKERQKEGKIEGQSDEKTENGPKFEDGAQVGQGWSPLPAFSPSLSPACSPSSEALLDLEPQKVAPFLGIGFGYLHVGALFEAMEHENSLDTADFWQHVQLAVADLEQGDGETSRRHLQSAADRLLSAREVLYPTTIHLLDIVVLDPDHVETPLPASFAHEMPLNLIACASLLERLAQQRPDLLAAVRQRLQSEQLEVLGGCYVEREEALLPVESQLWNLRKGLAISRQLLGQDLRVFARKRFGFHPHLPLLLQTAGLQRALLVAFDDAVLPSYSTTVVNWPAPDGKQIEAFTRTPYEADNPQTGFHTAHYLHRTIMQDHAATLALKHTGVPAGAWYHDWLELSRFGPVLGQWTTLSRYFSDVLAGEQASAAAPDDFQADYLSERTNAHQAHPVSGLARHVRLRRRIDTVWTLLAIYRGLTGGKDLVHLEAQLSELEDQIETGQQQAQELGDLQKNAVAALAERLLARAPAHQPGYLVLNPCSFTRRVALELEKGAGPWPITGPVKACQIEADRSLVVVEVPGLGFAWIPRCGPPGTPMPALRMRLADAHHVRNEFFEAAIDPVTGGLRGLWDRRMQISRIGQQLVFNPGSTMHASQVKVSSTGPALGEVVSEGALLGDQDQVLATFRQRFRAWLGRPVLDVRIEIYPEQQPAGYPWHNYFGTRFAWRDERAVLLRGVTGSGYVTSHTRPETPDYLEMRLGRQSTVLFSAGLPFLQRHGARMVDVILVPEGETAQTFDLALGLDREHPMQTSLGMITPVPHIPTSKGPPPIGPSGWLFHLDAPHLLLTSLRPGSDGSDRIIARLLECGQYGGQAEFRCARNPKRAVLLDARGETLLAASTRDDAAVFDVSPGDLVELAIEFA